MDDWKAPRYGREPDWACPMPTDDKPRDDPVARYRPDREPRPPVTGWSRVMYWLAMLIPFLILLIPIVLKLLDLDYLVMQWAFGLLYDILHWIFR